MNIAFYIAKHGTWFDKLIAWWTRPNFWKFWESGLFSHVEIVFGDGECFSASPREGKCRWKKIDFKHDRWVFVKLPDTYDELRIRYRCGEINGRRYDWIGIFFTFVLPFDFDWYRWYFCSEAVSEVVYSLQHPNRYSPNGLFNKVTSKFL